MYKMVTIGCLWSGQTADIFYVTYIKPSFWEALQFTQLLHSKWQALKVLLVEEKNQVYKKEW